MNDPAFDTSEGAEEEYFAVYATVTNSSFLISALQEIDKVWSIADLCTKSNRSKEERREVITDSSGRVEEESKKEENKEEVKDLSSLEVIIKLAMELHNNLKLKGTTRIFEKKKMTLKEANFVCKTFYRIYDQEMSQSNDSGKSSKKDGRLKIDNDVLNKLRSSKMLAGLDFVSTFPHLFKKVEANVNKAAPQLGQGPLIKLSRDQLKMTICKHTPGSSVKIDSSSKKLLSHRKF